MNPQMWAAKAWTMPTTTENQITMNGGNLYLAAPTVTEQEEPPPELTPLERLRVETEEMCALGRAA